MTTNHSEMFARSQERGAPCLLFDLDGTLADTNPLHERAWAAALAPLGFVVDHGFYQTKIAGQRNAEIVRNLLPTFSAMQATALADGKEAHFRKLAQHGLSAVQGLDALLSAARLNALAMALVTNAPRLNALEVLAALNVHFDVSVCAEDLPVGKPDPLPYQTALKLLGVESSLAIAFEDSPSGVRSAVAAGIATVGLLTGHDVAELQTAGAVLCVPDFSAPELWRWLASTWGIEP